MKREDLIAMYQSKRILDTSVVAELVEEYSLYKGKSQEEAISLAQLALSNPMLLPQVLEESKDYFLRRYNINFIIKDGEIISYY